MALVDRLAEHGGTERFNSPFLNLEKRLCVSFERVGGDLGTDVCGAHERHG